MVAVASAVAPVWSTMAWHWAGTRCASAPETKQGFRKRQKLRWGQVPQSQAVGLYSREDIWPPLPVFRDRFRFWFDDIVVAVWVKIINPPKMDWTKNANYTWQLRRWFYDLNQSSIIKHHQTSKSKPDKVLQSLRGSPGARASWSCAGTYQRSWIPYNVLWNLCITVKEWVNNHQYVRMDWTPLTFKTLLRLF